MGVSGLVAASAQEAHVIKGKRATCKKAEVRQGKIYVGKLPAEDLSNQDLTDHFNQFGSVVEVIRPVDKLKEDTPKNFCFVTFDKEEPAKQLVMKGFTSIKGHQVIVSRVATLAMEEDPTMASQGPIPDMGSGTPMLELTAMLGLMGQTLAPAREDISQQATLEDPPQGR